MIEIRFHGRGGQGAVLAAELLAHAAFLDGRVPQAFPFFGVERRGAPVTSYVRLDDRPIGLRTSITTPDVVVVLEPGLLRTQPVTEGLVSGGLLIVNSPMDPETIELPVDGRVATVDATRIARAHRLGSPTQPIVNTAMLGALARAAGVVSLASVERAIDECVPGRTAENRAAAADGHAAVQQASRRAAAARAVRPATASPLRPDGPMAATPSRTVATASWRTLTPVVHSARCTRCNFCWKFCPDAAIGFDAQGYPVVDLAHCKGCGICAAECPPRTIEMVEEVA